jgi:hypothetical protein
VQATETGTDDQYLSRLLTFLSRPMGQLTCAGMGVIAGNVLGGLLKHTGSMNFYSFNFMKKYTINFISAMI